MRRAVVLFVSLSVALALVPGVASADRGRPTFSPGAPGVGDPYFPLDGNGGYDVRHYDLDVAYDPATDQLTGRATITARATQNLSSFNLDLEGLTVRSIKVDHRDATWTRAGAELTVTPPRGIRNHTRFTTVISYDGIPQTLSDGSGFIHTDDGALVIGEPHVAATWFPVNDHPSDKASYTFTIKAPRDLQVVANGVLQRERSRGGQTTWTWDAREPMASYLAMMAIGSFDVRAYRANGLKFWDALDPRLFEPIAEPRTGTQYALSQAGDLSYKRLARTITVPPDGATVSFFVARDTELDWDYFFVEAHTVGQDDWTTLPAGQFTSQGTGNVCPFWLGLHPFLEHYQAANPDGSCTPSGLTGDWWAATGASDGYEQWTVDLSDFEGDVEVSLSYASDDVVQGRGVYIDDIVVSTGEGSTSFEADVDPMDGWAVPGAPEGSEPNPNDWIVGTAADAPPSPGEIADGSFARQPEIIDFLADNFGRYPFSASGGIVDVASINFALENQTRPIYAPVFFDNPINGDSVVVHELAHQWYGDSLAVERWQHIWLNEGFATYAEWLWSDHEGLGTAQEIFDSFYFGIPADDDFWQVTIGDPGVDDLFNIAVYWRGGMTLHQLRLTVGDADFFDIMQTWAHRQAGDNVTTDEFVALAEKISGQQLDELFQTWLFTPGRPELPGAAALRTAGELDVRHAPPVVRAQAERLGWAG